MAESQTQVKPQFIMWDKSQGVFRPARVEKPKDYTGHDLERNLALEAEDISPDTLNLTGSVYLGPINIYEEQFGHVSTRDAFERLREHKHGIVEGIVGLAERVAQEQRAPYFSVNVVQTEKDRVWKFKLRGDTLQSISEKYIDSSLRFNKLYSDEPPRPLEFVLHPTAQLYVPRR